MAVSDSVRILGNMRYFESVARHLSFTLAAHELCLTQSAVSYRVRMLERELGFPLFHRFVRRIELTDEGSRLLGVLQRSLSEMNAELQAIRAQELRGNLSIVCGPSFLGCWLLPRIRSFYAQFPGIVLHPRCQMNPVNFEHDRADMAIDYSQGGHTSLYEEKLMDETLFPVCSPAYITSHALETPAALADCQLLHDAQPWLNAHPYAEWKIWLEQAGITSIDLSRGHHFDRCEAALYMARVGAGVAMARGRLAEPWLRTGELARPFTLLSPSSQSYWLVMPHERVRNVRVTAFCTWLRQQAMESCADYSTQTTGSTISHISIA